MAEVAALPGFRNDPGWISATLHPPITVQQAEEALEMAKMKTAATGCKRPKRERR